MKKSFDKCPEGIEETYGFSWMEHVLAIPSPLVLVTGFKENGKPNATMQSWCAFTGEEGFLCLFSSVNIYGHMYKSLKSTGHCVVNFLSADTYKRCMETIRHNELDDDEITAAGLTAEPAEKVNAPKVRECFLNLECELVWERPLTEGGYHATMCCKVVNVCMDEEHYNAEKKGRYGKTGYLYNIHSPQNPESAKEEKTYIGIIEKLADVDEL